LIKTIKWNTGSAAERFRNTREKIQASREKQASKKKQASRDTQAPQLKDKN